MPAELSHEATEQLARARAHMTGRRDWGKARRALERAARAGAEAARADLAMVHAYGFGIKADFDHARALLIEAAQTGHGPALRQLAVFADGAGDAGLALALLAHAAQAGDVLAQCLLGRRLLAQDPAQGRHWLGRAAAAKHALAVYLMKGQPAADQAPPPPPALDGLDWARLAQADLATPGPVQVQPVAKLPLIKLLKAAFSPAECAYIQALAACHLRPSDVIDPDTGRIVVDPYRTGFQAQLVPDLADVVIAAIDARLAALTDTRVKQGESLTVLVYQPGQEYKPHWDHLVDTADEKLSRLKASGQRLYTALITLDDGFAGGATAFTDIGVQVRGQVGDVLLFRNLNDRGKPDALTMHAGLPVEAGVKWLASKWIRERNFAL